MVIFTGRCANAETVLNSSTSPRSAQVMGPVHLPARDDVDPRDLLIHDRGLRRVELGHLHVFRQQHAGFDLELDDLVEPRHAVRANDRGRVFRKLHRLSGCRSGPAEFTGRGRSATHRLRVEPVADFCEQNVVRGRGEESPQIPAQPEVSDRLEVAARLLPRHVQRGSRPPFPTHDRVAPQ